MPGSTEPGGLRGHLEQVVEIEPGGRDLRACRRLLLTGHAATLSRLGTVQSGAGSPHLAATAAHGSAYRPGLFRYAERLTRNSCSTGASSRSR